MMKLKQPKNIGTVVRSSSDDVGLPKAVWGVEKLLCFTAQKFICSILEYLMIEAMPLR